jgi:hypothetical protein
VLRPKLLGQAQQVASDRNREVAAWVSVAISVHQVADTVR